MFYAGAEEKHAFASALEGPGGRGERGDDRVRPFRSSAARLHSPERTLNASLLDTCGKLVVHADDDSVFPFRRPTGSRPRAAVFLGRRTRRKCVFSGTAEEREAGRGAARCGPPGRPSVTARPIGGGLPAAVRGAGRLRRDGPGVPAGPGIGRRQGGGHHGRGVRRLGNGFAAVRALAYGPQPRAALHSEERYRSALRSRQVLRAVTRTTLTQSTLFMKMRPCGLDNRLALPPFLPVLRNEDGLFAQSLTCLPAARPDRPPAPGDAAPAGGATGLLPENAGAAWSGGPAGDCWLGTWRRPIRQAIRSSGCGCWVSG